MEWFSNYKSACRKKSDLWMKAWQMQSNSASRCIMERRLFLWSLQVLQALLHRMVAEVQAAQAVLEVCQAESQRQQAHQVQARDLVRPDHRQIRLRHLVTRVPDYKIK